jgi:L-ascorbate metabolism protein UlaG (beta-lactamase superfamily)
MIEITWLGHSSFELRVSPAETILFDPWLDNPKYPAGHSIQRADTILISHGHFDHMASVADLARRFHSKVVSNYEICSWLAAQGITQTLPMNKGGGQQVGSCRVTMTHALHSSGIQDADGKLIYGGEAGGFVLEFADGRAVYFAGDTDVFGDMQLIGELYKPELVFLPVGDLFTMGPRQAELAIRLLRPKKVIPMHWGTFPPLTGKPEDVGRAEIWKLDPGQTVKW